MPTIPLIRTTAPVGDAPAPVLDRERRPTSDTSGMQRALGQLNDASKMPMMDPQAMAAPYEALGSVGRAIQQTGSIIGAAAMKEKEALAIRQTGEFNAAYTNALAEFEAWKDDPENKKAPEEWPAEMERTLGRLTNTFASNEKLTPEARSHIGNLMNVKKAEEMRGVALASRKAIYQGAADTMNASIMDAIVKQKEPEFKALQKQALDGGYISKSDALKQDQLFKEHGLQLGREAADAQFSAAINLGNKDLLEYSIQTGKARAGWDVDMERDRRALGEKKIAQKIETDRNQAQAQFTGTVLMAKAQGETFVPAQVDSWVKEGKMDTVTGANLRQSLQREVGSMPGEFEKFVTEKVLTYDPESDPTLTKWQAIQSEAVGLNLNATQAGRYDMLMSQAKSGRNPEEKALNYLKTNARSFISKLDDEGGLGPKWKSEVPAHAAPAVKDVLKDYNSLFNFGISKDAAEKITKLDGPEALRMFREASLARTRSDGGKQVTSIDTDKYNSLPPEKKTLLENLTNSDKAVDVIDAAARLKSGIQAAELNGRLDTWFDTFKAKEKRLPNEKEVQGKMNEMLQPYLHERAIDIFQGKKAPVSTSAAGVTVGGSLIDRVKQFESFIPKAYDDFKQVSIGYGTRALRGEDEIDEATATSRLHQELTEHASRVDSYAKKKGIALKQNQRDALISFDFNTGAAPRVLEKAGGDLSKVPEIMKQWRNAGGSVLPGLVKRRAQEAEWFNSDS